MLDKHSVFKPVYQPKKTVIIMDTLYFRHSFGVMVFRDEYKRRNLHWHYVKYETIALYKEGIDYLKRLGWQIEGIVCDGRRGIFKAFRAIPMQMCHYHQQAIIKRYLTQNPRLEPAIELKEISSLLSNTNKEVFALLLNNWYLKWEIFLKEKTVHPETKRWHYTHKRIRSAYRSIMSHLDYLFTYQMYSEKHIPNTTNSLEGSFSNLRSKLRNHSGLTDIRKMKVVDHFLAK